MKNVKEITKKVHGAIGANTFMLHFEADLNDIPPFMCSPFNDGWVWSESLEDLKSYIFEIIVADYLINDAMAFGEYTNVGDKEFDFIEACKAYKSVKNAYKDRISAVEKLEKLYAEDNACNYRDFVKMLYDVETSSQNAGLAFEFTSFSTPLEARHCGKLSSDTFDEKNLGANFN